MIPVFYYLCVPRIFSYSQFTSEPVNISSSVQTRKRKAEEPIKGRNAKKLQVEAGSASTTVTKSSKYSRARYLGHAPNIAILTQRTPSSVTPRHHSVSLSVSRIPRSTGLTSHPSTIPKSLHLIWIKPSYRPRVATFSLEENTIGSGYMQPFHSG